MKIDAHQHYWHPARGDYDWMPMDNPVLARPYGPADLEPALAQAGIDQTIIVQAAATVQETEYLLGMADTHDSVAGVVGWVDFENPADRLHLERLAGHPKFLGVRPMLQDIPDDDWMLRDDIQWAFQALIDLDLTLDALGFPQHLDNFHTLLTRYPTMRVVIDHCMKPQIAKDPAGFDAWAAGMTRLATDTQAFCKLSGLVTEASEDWSVEDLKPYANHVLNVFGPDRVMWGSDWPVCRLRGEYADWIQAAETLLQGYSEKERAAVFGENAARFYLGSK